MMGLAGLVQEFGDLRLGVTHGHTSFPSNPFSVFSARSLAKSAGKDKSTESGEGEAP
jgi:hypothetical protein